MKRQSFLVSIVILFALQSSGFADTINHAEQYKACMKLVKHLPNEAFDAGLTWKGLGGGEAAEHCIATSLIALKNYKTGAEKLETLANTSRRPKEFKAKLLAQAAQGWFLANQTDRARAVITTALSLDDTQADFYVDRAQMRSSQNAFKEARDDLDTALSIEENHIDALVYRASIHRLLEEFDPAWADVSRALAFEPAHQEGLLERGMLNRIKGNDAHAREDWLDAISQDPNNPTAETARLNLQKMDVKETLPVK